MDKKRNITLFTDDGSTSLKSEYFDETYHSKFGAVAESNHVFINAGLQERHHQNSKNKELRIFEIGFGTGLNAVLTLQWAENTSCRIFYHAIELFPLNNDRLNTLNHADFIDNTLRENVHQIQYGEWNQTFEISPYFTLYKQQISLLDLQLSDNFFDVVFFDAFSPNVQPELWTESVFQKLYNASRENAVLTTYCVKGDVRRALKSAGFYVEKIPGPPGKREIIRAKKDAPKII